jgi:hypothetical protein
MPLHVEWCRWASEGQNLFMRCWHARAPGQEDILDDAKDALALEAQRLRVHHRRVDQVEPQRVRAVRVQDLGRVLRARL